jgi:hypothetical protein
MTIRTIYTEVEVDVDLSEFSTTELLAELRDRDTSTTDYLDNHEVLLGKIYEAKRNGADYSELLDQLIYQQIGRIL